MKELKILTNSQLNELNSMIDDRGRTQNRRVKMETKWLSPEETCQLLRISRRTLQSYRDFGKLPFSQVCRKIYFKREDVEEFLERHYVKSSYWKGCQL